ncbi:TlpA family protein disulfide reductase [Myxococcota bacterium]|nr:TlpA family protein disulfide reductase [Myxococcota bacterium]
MTTERTTRRGLLTTIAALVGLQGVAVGGYLFVESKKRARDARFPVEALTRGPALPALELARADGTKISMTQLGGRPLLVHFWATWCPPCVEELPELLALARDGALAMVLVSLDDDWSVVARFFDGEIPREVVRDPGRRVAKHYGVGTLPDGYLVDGEGIARVRLAGARSWSGDAARDALAPFMVR